MKQTGILSVRENNNGQSTIMAIPNAYLYFKQGNTIRAQTRTDANGRFDFDLPLGEYVVMASMKDRGAQQHVFASGELFKLTSASSEKALENWLNRPEAVDANGALLNEMREMMRRTEEAAAKVEEWAKTKRDIDDNHFHGALQVQSDNSGGTGVFLQDAQGTVRGQMMFSNTGLQFAQQVDGKGYNYGLPKSSGELLNDKSIIPINRGGTGATTAAKARENLGALGVGDYGFGGAVDVRHASKETLLESNKNPSEILSFAHVPPISYGVGMKLVRESNGHGGFFAFDRGNFIFGRHTIPNDELNFAIVLHNKNTTTDTNGFIKAASPIIRLFDDRIEHNDQFEDEPQFKKLDTGVYEISNTLGLAREGWYIETPKNRNGFPLLMVDWEQKEDNTVIIRTFERKLDIETLDFVNGDPVDIGKRWIDLRFHEEEKEEVEDEEH